MKPEYIGVGNFDEDNYVYAYCKCPLSVDYAIKWPRIKDGKVHSYTCTCEECGTEVGVISKSYGPEVLSKEPCTDAISREAVKNIIRGGVCTDTEADQDYVCELIDELPPVTPKHSFEGMTNGEVIKKMFPNIRINDNPLFKEIYTEVPLDNYVGANIDCMREWWNALYKGGAE